MLNPPAALHEGIPLGQFDVALDACPFAPRHARFLGDRFLRDRLTRTPFTFAATFGVFGQRARKLRLRLRFEVGLRLPDLREPLFAVVVRIERLPLAILVEFDRT